MKDFNFEVTKVAKVSEYVEQGKSGKGFVTITIKAPSAPTSKGKVIPVAGKPAVIKEYLTREEYHFVKATMGISG